MLDIGCGEGRLLNVFADYFDTLTAIEPDAGRFAVAKELVLYRNDTDKFRLFNGPLSELMGGQFDFVLCSHIIQHLSDRELISFLGKAAALVASGGLLVITTNHSLTDKDQFFKAQ